jgi:hypothetical protein
MKNKENLIKNLMEDAERKKSLLDNLIQEIELLKREKLEMKNNFHYFSNQNYNREIQLNNDFKHLKV